MPYVPLPSVTTERVKPVSVWVTVTVTPGSTAPLSSVTRPLSSAVAWAKAMAVDRTSTAAPYTHPLRIRIIAPSVVVTRRRRTNVTADMRAIRGEV